MRGGRTRPRDLRSQGPRFRVNRPAVSVNRGGARTARRWNTPRERAAESCKARGRNRANVRLHVREMSAGARLVRPPKIRRSLVKQGDPGSRSRTARPRSRPGSARGRGFRRPSAGPSSAVHPALDRPSAGPRRVCRRGPENGPSSPTTRPADLDPCTLAAAPERPASRPSSRPHTGCSQQRCTRSHSAETGDFSALASVRGRLCADFAPRNRRPRRRSDGPKRARSQQRAHLEHGGRRKTGGRTTHARADISRTCSRTNARFCRGSLQDFDAGEAFDEKRGGAQRMPAPTFPERAAGQMPTFERHTNPLHQL